ncbi:hypothetical protein KAFR_0I02050 [Kazachstania africana CBS 2517]|uniref:ABC1 atypical kinase-like domain-containing protein n=1 Tax=Kazachstania africana (strain ATCC 22294 / BCRC 22015 / CBS 2517 / CECT 1963 / NBRC 1671 / NRRL Y-8276) TaxID=1071382 RepID=H2B035_KAZAF|nr:hypothetical protein KAFR_0I02050 [Kazachstania africana CBS 2517]CCF59985.1 hypothetical protein KAFR_0I02050 [Kazachstania africana CBS 2517]
MNAHEKHVKGMVVNLFPRILFRTYAKHHPTRSSVFRTNTRKLLIAGSTVTFTIILYNTNEKFHDSIRHASLTTKRVSVVGQATLRCIYHYKKVLNKKFKDQDLRTIELNKTHKRCALITLHALERNGGVFIKLGQHIGAMSYMLPKQWTETMTPLQDKCPESKFEDINQMFIDDLGVGINQLFSQFNKVPIGVASLAQVYTGEMRNSGEKVAIKCQHPELKEFVPLDVWLTKTVFSLLNVVFPEYPLKWLSDELQSSIYNELDFRQEAKNAKRTSEYFKDFTKLTALRIPRVIRSDSRILIMEYIGGKRLDDLNYMDSHGISRSEVSSCLSHIFNNMIFTPGVGLHCDPHGGNLAIRRCEKTKERPYNFEIILYDHGLYRYPETQMRRDYAKFWLALLDQDEVSMRKYAKKFAKITDKQFPLFAAAVTGRSIDIALHYDISKRRGQDEVRTMTMGLLEGTFLSDIMNILSRIPRIVLLILKTNDLTRFLDETLDNPLGPERTFLIMTQYCAKTVYDEKCEINDSQCTGLTWVWHKCVNWINFQRRKDQLYLYDFILWWRSFVFGLFRYI